MILSHQELFDFLEAKYEQYNQPEFIETDPVSVPHRFTRKEDIEIAGFLTATLSWGNRQSIVKDADRLIRMMDYAPYDFILNAGKSEIAGFNTFYHRTFKGEDCLFFLTSLKNIYHKYKGLEPLFIPENKAGIKEVLGRFRSAFLEIDHPSRSDKHIADPAKGASAKRLLMFLRWMARNDKKGVDFGLWKKIPASLLMCPLDVHSGNVARKLGLLQRKQNDWKAVEELTANLRQFDPEDPVKYDFALFGLGVFEHF
jgi:uncharacterized protein (TIGR02757 family)